MDGQATVKSSKLEQNAGEGPEVYVCLADISKNDTQHIENEHHTGVQSRPPKESRGFWSFFNDSWKYFTNIFDGVPRQALNEGERISYSSDNAEIKAFIKYLNTGILHINGDTDFAVRFNELETAFNELKTAYNTHSGHTTGSVASPQSAADISTAKVETVKLPGVAP